MEMKLNFFTGSENFPFAIHYGHHDEDLVMHHHSDFSELTIVLDGKAEHCVNDEVYTIAKGDIFVIGKGIYHGYKNPEHFRICNVMFRPEALLNEDYDVKKCAGYHALFLVEPAINASQGFKARLKLRIEDFLRLEELIAVSIDEFNNDNPGRNTLRTAYFLHIVTFLSRLYTTSARHRESDNIANAAAFMESNYMNDISISSLLDVSHYSQRHFIRLFSEIYNTTPQKYLLGIRINQACRLLRETRLPVTDISCQCGFNDPNYFSRAFKKATGRSPLSFRAASRSGM